MKDKETDIKECFAYFGRAIYVAQTVEKGILNSLISSYENLTKSCYDELLAEKSQLTLGQLKREIIERKIFSEEIIDKIETFHTKRDWLAHNYWWDRAIEFNRDDLRHKIFTELDELTAYFDNLNEIIKDQNNKYLIEKGLNIDQLINEFSQLNQTPESPSTVKLTKNETLTGLYIYETMPGFEIPLFKLENNSYWTLCESGLTAFNLEIDNSKLKPLEKTNGIFPVKQFNPKPKIKRDWEYELDLKKEGLSIKVKPFEVDGKFVFKWTI